LKLTDIGIKKIKPREKTFKLFDGGLNIQIEPTGGNLWRTSTVSMGKKHVGAHRPPKGAN